MNNFYYKKYNKYKLKYLNATNNKDLYGGMQVEKKDKHKMPGYDDLQNEYPNILINNVIAFYYSIHKPELNQYIEIDKYYRFQCLGNIYPCTIEIEIDTFIGTEFKQIPWTFHSAEAALQAAKFNHILLRNPSLTDDITYKSTKHNFKKLESIFTMYIKEGLLTKENYFKKLHHLNLQNKHETINKGINLIYFFTLQSSGKGSGEDMSLLKEILEDLLQEQPKYFIASENTELRSNCTYGIIYSPYRRYGYGLAWMIEVIIVKFSNNKELKNILLSTDKTFIIEHNVKPGRDYMWSDNCNGYGNNILGLVLMLVRDILMDKNEWIDYLLKCEFTDSDKDNIEKNIDNYNLHSDKGKIENSIDEVMNHYKGKSLFLDYQGIYLALPEQWTTTVLKIATYLNMAMQTKFNIYDEKIKIIRNLNLDSIQQFVEN